RRHAGDSAADDAGNRAAINRRTRKPGTASRRHLGNTTHEEVRLMRFLGFFAACALAVACQVAAFTRPAPAQDMQMTPCPAFTSVKWVSPMDASESGTQYQVTLTQHDMTCDQATTWAKKLIPQHIDGKPMMPSYPPLTGGPP